MITSAFQNMKTNTQDNKRKIEKAKTIIAKIFDLTGSGNDWELNKATDAMYDYIKEIELLIVKDAKQ